jgi:small subunit ribosomal protein S20
LAHHPSAIKRNRQNAKRRSRNRTIKSGVKTQIKTLLASVEAGDVELTRLAMKMAQKLLMKAASKNVIRKQTASRQISRLARKQKSIQAGPALRTKSEQ